MAAIASEEDVLCRGIGRADQARDVPRRVARGGDDQEGPVAPNVVAVLEGGDLRRRVVPREFGHVAVRLDGVDLVARLGADNHARVREREQASRAAVVKVVVFKARNISAHEVVRRVSFRLFLLKKRKCETHGR